MALTEISVHRNRLAAIFTPQREAVERAADGDIAGTEAVLNGVTGRMFVRGEVRRVILEKAQLNAPQVPAQ